MSSASDFPPDASFADRVRRPQPGVEAHLAAVRAALRDGRLRVTHWAARADVPVTVAELWAEDRPLQESFQARLWSSAVTTNVPGWDAPGEALAVGDGSGPISEEQRRRARAERRRATWTGGNSSLAAQGAHDEPGARDGSFALAVVRVVSCVPTTWSTLEICALLVTPQRSLADAQGNARTPIEVIAAGEEELAARFMEWMVAPDDGPELERA